MTIKTGEMYLVSAYIENITFAGGSKAIQFYAYNSTRRRFGMKNCNSYYAQGDCTDVTGNVDCIFENCVSAEGDSDGFNYHWYDPYLFSAIEINCKGFSNGDGSLLTNNGSTIHDGGIIARFGCEYYDNYGPNVADVNSSFCWNVNVESRDSAAPSNNYDFYIDGDMWCDRCTGSTYEVYTGATLYATADTTDLTGVAYTTYSRVIGSMVPGYANNSHSDVFWQKHIRDTIIKRMFDDPVLSVVSSLPSSPENGDRHILSTTNQIIQYDAYVDNTWIYGDPHNHAAVFCLDDGYTYRWEVDRFEKLINHVLTAQLTGDGASGTVTDIMTYDVGDSAIPTLALGEFWDVRIEITGTRTGGDTVSGERTNGKWILDAYIQQGTGSSSSLASVNNSGSSVSAVAVGAPYSVYDVPTIAIDGTSGTGELRITVSVTDPNATVFDFTARVVGIARTGTPGNVPV
jgi:hypothetical protein